MVSALIEVHHDCYELTERGEAALVLRDRYDTADDFDALVDQYRSGEHENPDNRVRLAIAFSRRKLLWHCGL